LGLSYLTSLAVASVVPKSISIGAKLVTNCDDPRQSKILRRYEARQYNDSDYLENSVNVNAGNRSDTAALRQTA
jgi:hypothetical protein